jgi:serine/threonine protein kinase
MGTVYLAVRADHAFRKQVALKIVRPEAGSKDVLRRFQRKREILATLGHSNIARLLDGGSTEDGLAAQPAGTGASHQRRPCSSVGRLSRRHRRSVGEDGGTPGR